MANQPLTTKADETPEFVLFWEQWRKFARKNDGRGEARDTFVKHIKAGADGSDIADGATWYLNNLTERDKEYIPLASTWINRRAYEDMAEQHRSHMAVIEERRARRAQEQSTNVVSIDAERRAEMADRLKSVAAAMRVVEAG